MEIQWNQQQNLQKHLHLYKKLNYLYHFSVYFIINFLWKKKEKWNVDGFVIRHDILLDFI